MFNADTFLGFLKKLRMASCHTDRRVIVVLDNAKYQHGNLHEDWRNRARPALRWSSLYPTVLTSVPSNWYGS